MKKDNQETTIKTGVNFLEMLFLLFLGLKLADKIDWSWWWVFAPIWMPLVIVGIAIIGMVIYLILTNVKGKGSNEASKKN